MTARVDTWRIFDNDTDELLDTVTAHDQDDAIAESTAAQAALSRGASLFLKRVDTEAMED